MVEILEKIPEQEHNLTPQQLVRMLWSITDVEPDVGSVDDLSKFLKELSVLEAFSGAINEFGKSNDWYGDLSAGVNSGEGRFLSAEFSRPPVLNGGSILHIYELEDNEPSFGLLLPFNELDDLDTRRGFSASSFLNQRVFYIRPYETPTKEQAQDQAEICATTAWVVRLAAKSLASMFEREVPLNLSEQLGL